MNEGNIGLFQAVSLVVLAIINKIFYSSAAAIVQRVGTAAWYSTLGSCIISLVFFCIIYMLMKRFPGMNLIQIFDEVVGKFLGKILGMILCAYCVFYAGSNLREFVDMIKIYNLPQTPPSFIMGCILLVSMLITYFGFKGLGQLCGICLVPVILGLVLVFSMAYPIYNFNHLKPYLGYGIIKTLKSEFLRSSSYSEFIILFVVTDSLRDLKEIKKAGIISIIFSGIVFMFCFMFYLASFNYAFGEENISGIFELSKTIYFNRFIQRVETIFLMTWVIPSMITTAIAFYICISIYCKIYNIKDHKPLLLPFAFLVFVVAIIPKNIMELISINLALIREYSMFINYFIPTAVLIIAILLKRKGGNSNVQKN
ncbi:endospore germination permease [Clostridium sp. MT-14]|uniref:Spore germination protein n=1 Tax=Clostridium aromativorans TaxID=2836848 RepID=A0ABS8N319_9CLOT|nr:endospore germination permease [Clostridium aromativorans]MCC9294091.1 spore germination protein [Clostridium aromativorans]